MSDSESEKKSHRVVRLSRVDAQRLAAGEISSPEEALHVWDAGPVLSRPDSKHRDKPAPHDLHERELMENVPPHFGKI